MKSMTWLLVAVLAGTASAETLTIEKALAEIQRNYFAPDLPEFHEKLREGAIRGALRALNELQAKHLGLATPAPKAHWQRDDEGVNRLYSPEEFTLFKQEVSGKFGGVGMKLGPPGGSKPDAKEPAPPPYVVLEAIKGMPAEKAGVQKDDVIRSVDGTPVTTMYLQDLVLKLRGPAGSRLKVGLERAGKPVEVVLERQEIRLPAATLAKRDGGTALLKIRVFDGGAAGEIRAAVETAARDKLWGMVIDLRGCPGGQLDVCIEACRLLLSKGQVIVRTRRKGEPEKTYTAEADPLWQGTLVVLVDKETASSGELFAGALKDNGKALVAGARTFGKSTAEMLLELPDGFAMKVTSQVLYRPGGQETTRGGVTPDVPLAPEPRHDDDEKSEQVEAAFRILALARPKGP